MAKSPMELEACAEMSRDPTIESLLDARELSAVIQLREIFHSDTVAPSDHTTGLPSSVFAHWVYFFFVVHGGLHSRVDRRGCGNDPSQ